MKTKHMQLLKGLFIAGTSCLLLSACKGEKNSDQDILVEERSEPKSLLATGNLPGEDPLLLSYMEVEANVAIPLIHMSKHCLSINSVTVPPLSDIVPISSLGSMTLAASQLTAAVCNYSVTGLKVIYGIKAGKIKLYYRPVLFCRASDSYGQNYEHFGNYNCIEGSLYEIRNSAFVAAVPGDSIYIANYKDSIHIERTNPTSPSPTPFETGDVTALVFSFQEMYELIANNNGAASLKLWNYMRDVSLNTSPQLKHSLFISTDNAAEQPDGTVLFTGSAGRYANLSHLCPSACSTSLFTFRLANQAK